MVNMHPQVQKVKEMNIGKGYMCFNILFSRTLFFLAMHPIISCWNTSDTRLKWPGVPSLTFHNCLTWNLNYLILSWMDSAVTQYNVVRGTEEQYWSKFDFSYHPPFNCFSVWNLWPFNLWGTNNMPKWSVTSF